MDNKISMARSVAPEDIKIGSYIMTLARYDEFARWACEMGGGGGVQFARVRWTPDDGQKPRRVVAVCLPFVLLEDEKGESSVVDTRNASFARVKRKFAETVWARARKPARDRAGTPADRRNA